MQGIILGYDIYSAKVSQESIFISGQSSEINRYTKNEGVYVLTVTIVTGASHPNFGVSLDSDYILTFIPSPTTVLKASQAINFKKGSAFKQWRTIVCIRRLTRMDDARNIVIKVVKAVMRLSGLSMHHCTQGAAMDSVR